MTSLKYAPYEVFDEKWLKSALPILCDEDIRPVNYKRKYDMLLKVLPPRGSRDSGHLGYMIRRRGKEEQFDVYASTRELIGVCTPECDYIRSDEALYDEITKGIKAKKPKKRRMEKLVLGSGGGQTMERIRPVAFDLPEFFKLDEMELIMYPEKYRIMSLISDRDSSGHKISNLKTLDDYNGGTRELIRMYRSKYGIFWGFHRQDLYEWGGHRNLLFTTPDKAGLKQAYPHWKKAR